MKQNKSSKLKTHHQQQPSAVPCRELRPDANIESAKGDVPNVPRIGLGQQICRAIDAQIKPNQNESPQLKMQSTGERIRQIPRPTAEEIEQCHRDMRASALKTLRLVHRAMHQVRCTPDLGDEPDEVFGVLAEAERLLNLMAGRKPKRSPKRSSIIKPDRVKPTEEP